MMKSFFSLLTSAALVFTSISTPTIHAQEKQTDQPTIYARLGGQGAIDAAVDLFYVKVLADDRVNFFFEDINMKAQVRKQKEFLGAALGGPTPWEGKDMRAAHKNLEITEADFGVIAEHLLASLEELNVPEPLIGEIMAVVGSVKNAVLNRPEGD